MNASEVTCTACGTPLPPTEPTTTAPDIVCPECGRVITVFRFPALARRGGNTSSGSVAQHGEAACFHHAEKQAEAVCESCGRFLCGLCRIEFNSRTLCPACLALTQTADAETHIPRRLRYDKLAMLSIVLSPFVYCLSIFNAFFSLYLCIRHWRTPISVLPRSRWRFPVAGLLSLGLLAIWISVGATAVYQIYHAREKSSGTMAQPRPPRSPYVK